MQPSPLVWVVLACLHLAVIIRPAQGRNGNIPLVTNSGHDYAAGAKYAVLPSTIVAGRLPSTSQQYSINACAKACDDRSPWGNLACGAFSYCKTKGGCPEQVDSSTTPLGACHLLLPFLAADLAVRRHALDRPSFLYGDIKLLAGDLGPVQGYALYPARALQYQVDVPCEGSLLSSHNACHLALTLQEAVATCDAMPGCQGFALGPYDIGTSTVGLANFKSSGGNTPVEWTAAVLVPGAAFYVKKSKEAFKMPVPAGMLPGAIAGIVLGALAGLVGLFFGALLWHQRQLQGELLWAVVPLGERSRKQGSSSIKDTEQGNSSGQGHSSCTGHLLMQTSGISRQSMCLSGAMTPLKEDGRSHASEFQAINVPTPQWEDVCVPWEDVELQCNAEGKLIKLGSGSSGAVYRALIQGATTCAAKLHKFGSDPKAAKRFIQEACMLWRLNSYCNAHIVSFLGASLKDGEGLLLMEYMAGGDLHDALQTQLPDGRGRLYGWYNRGRRVALQVAVGLQHLHRHNIVHRDIKPKNILLTRDGTAKLGDVGFARLVHPEHLSSLSICLGTFEWVAPEVLLGGSATETCDMYSFGIVLWGICTGQHPKRGSLRGLRVPDECPQAVADLQLQCVATEPHLRPSAAEAVKVLRSCLRAPRPSGERSSSSGSSHSSSKAGIPRHISTPNLLGLAAGSASTAGPSAFAGACSAAGAAGKCAPGAPAAEAAPAVAVESSQGYPVTQQGLPLTRKPSFRSVTVGPLMSSMHSPLLMMERACTAPPASDALPQLLENLNMASWLQPPDSPSRAQSTCKPPLPPALERMGST